jgi:hypothetical protein
MVQKAHIQVMNVKFYKNKPNKCERLTKICLKWLESYKKHERKQQQEKDKNELHEMVMKEVQQSLKEMFKLQKHHHSDADDSNNNESHQLESMEDITVSAECFNLSNLRQPPTKKTQTQHFAPITTALLET